MECLWFESRLHKKVESQYFPIKFVIEFRFGLFLNDFAKIRKFPAKSAERKKKNAKINYIGSEKIFLEMQS
jgi:hypothetical protein